MGKEIFFDVNLDLIYVDRPTSIILEAFRVRKRIELMGLKISKLSFKSTDHHKTQPKINCRDSGNNFTVLVLQHPDNRSNRRALSMLLIALGEICRIPTKDVDVFYLGVGKRTSISTKHKRGASQEKFEKSLKNEALLNQLRISFERSQSNELKKIESDLVSLAVNNRISQDIAVQYCNTTGISHQDLYRAFLDLGSSGSFSQTSLPEFLELPPVPFDEHMREIDAIMDESDFYQAGVGRVLWFVVGTFVGALIMNFMT